ncbi:MAG: hypothetical protein DRI46_10675 [Chloroflexi bacterium]|nr:MAG: hypothetical protein DRI46_10675 [Chloroflexota bacterium]
MPNGCNKPGCQGGYDSVDPEKRIPYVMKAKSDTLIAFMRVKHKNGVISVDRAARFMVRGKKILLPGVQFVEWITRCSECYTNDQQGKI